jgi:hypothetical protein
MPVTPIRLQQSVIFQKRQDRFRLPLRRILFQVEQTGAALRFRNLQDGVDFSQERRWRLGLDSGEHLPFRAAAEGLQQPLEDRHPRQHYPPTAQQLFGAQRHFRQRQTF